MYQDTLNMTNNFNDFSINDSSFQEMNSQNQDYNICFSSNMNPNKYKIEEESFLNNYCLSQKSCSIDKEFNKENQIEKNTKSIINKEMDIPFNFKETNISSQKINKENKEQFIDIVKIEKLKKNLNKQSYLGKKRRNENCFTEHNKYSDDNLRRKSKHLIVENLREFINGTIKAV